MVKVQEEEANLGFWYFFLYLYSFVWMLDDDDGGAWLLVLLLFFVLDMDDNALTMKINDDAVFVFCYKKNWG